MRILIYLAHPAQYHFFKNTVKALRKNRHNVVYVIRSKDILEELLKEGNEEYLNILKKERNSSIKSLVWSLLKRDYALYNISKRFKPQIMLGTDASLAHVGSVLNIPVFTTLEDDYPIIKKLAKITYPFTTHIFAPEICDVSRWDFKKIGYNGYMKLAYLHPNYFELSNETKIGGKKAKKKILIRTSKLNAYHDHGIGGLNYNLIKSIIDKFEYEYEIIVSSESEIHTELKKFIINIKSSEIHSLLSQCHLLISDSQSMTVEAAMLGIPSVRFSDFVGRINVLEELEKKYSLTYGFKTSNHIELICKIDELLSQPNLKEIYQIRRKNMLNEKIDVTAFLIWIIENYPDSISMLKENPEIQNRFK